MGLQHDISHEGLSTHGAIGLFCGWGECVVWVLLYPDTDFPIRSRRGKEEESAAILDDFMLLDVCGTRHILKMVLVGLYVQYGSQCCDRHYPECSMDLVQSREIQEVRTTLGIATRCGSCLHPFSNELGVVGFSAVEGMSRCAQSVASGDGGSYYDLV